MLPGQACILTQSKRIDGYNEAPLGGPTGCDDFENPRGTYMGHRSPSVDDNADLAWLVNHWKLLPPEVKMTIMTVARNMVTLDQ